MNITASDKAGAYHVWNYTFTELIKVFIIFPDRTEKVFDEKILRNFPFFDVCLTAGFKEAEDRRITLQSSSAEDLDLLIALFVHHRFLSDVLDENSLCDPDTFEHIEEQIQFYFLDESNEALNILREQVLFLPYDSARKLYSHDQLKVKQEEDINSFQNNKINFYMDAAHKIVHEACFFRSVEVYEKEYLSKLRKYQKNLKASKLLISKLEDEYDIWQKNEISLKTIRVAIRSQNAFCAKLSHKISQTLELLDPRNLRPAILWNVAQNYHNDHFTKSPQVELAKRYYDIFIQRVLNTLQYQKMNNTQMCRTDLLKFLDLFAYYNLEPDFSKGCFRCRELDSFVFFFSLDNETPNDLQEEIRKNLHLLDLPEPLNLTAERADFSNIKLYEGDKRAAYIIENLFLSYTTELNTEIINALISFWKWDELNITEDMIKINPLPIGTLKENVNRLVGKIQTYQTVIPFFFTLDDLQPIVLHEAINPTVQESREFIQHLIQEAYEMFTENYTLAEGN